MPPLSALRKLESNLLNQSKNQPKLLWDSFLVQQGEDGTNKCTDVHLICEDGAIPAHSIILASVSPFLHKLFKLQGNAPCRTILFPEFKVRHVALFIQFIYCGYVNIQSKYELEQMNEVLVAIGMNIADVTEDTYSNKNTDILYYENTFSSKEIIPVRKSVQNESLQNSKDIDLNENEELETEESENYTESDSSCSDFDGSKAPSYPSTSQNSRKKNTKRKRSHVPNASQSSAKRRTSSPTKKVASEIICPSELFVSSNPNSLQLKEKSKFLQQKNKSSNLISRSNDGIQENINSTDNDECMTSPSETSEDDGSSFSAENPLTTRDRGKMENISDKSSFNSTSTISLRKSSLCIRPAKLKRSFQIFDSDDESM